MDEVTESNESVVVGAFPSALLDWAGHRPGGVRRLFDASSGRPIGRVIKTHLLNRLEAWTKALAEDPDQAPRIVLLVGAPGNGKTEAVESTIQWLDAALCCEGTLENSLKMQVAPTGGQGISRVARSEARLAGIGGSALHISIVQDASVEEQPVGSSRVDLQACKLEYSIVSPK